MVLEELCAIMVASFGEEKVKGKPETIVRRGRLS